MSKKVTYTSNAIYLDVSGEYVAMASDGQIYHVGCDTERGQEVDEDNGPVVTRKALTAIKRLLPAVMKTHLLQMQLDAAKRKLEASQKQIERGDLGAIRLVAGADPDCREDDGDAAGSVGIGVGCTFILAKDVAATLKKLGIK